MRTMILMSVFVVFLLGGETSFADDAKSTASLKIGYVDMNKALGSTQAGKAADQQLKKEFQQKEKELKAKKGDLDAMMENLKKQSMVISSEVRSQKEKALYEEQLKFQKLVAESNLAIQKRERELTEPILEQLQDVIEETAKKENHDIILPGAAILWAKPHFDLTDQVIRRFDEIKKAKGSKKK